MVGIWLFVTQKRIFLDFSARISQGQYFPDFGIEILREGLFPVGWKSQDKRIYKCRRKEIEGKNKIEK